MEQLKCPNCGGNVDRERMICPYCGTQFKRDRDDNFIRIETYTPKMGVIEAAVIVGEWDAQALGTKTTAEYMTKELANKIAESIAPFMEIRTSYDAKRLEYMVRGRVRILEPDYRF